MANPILLIAFPMQANYDSVYHTQRALSNKLEGEYHVITYQAPEISTITFSVLNAIDATDVEIETLISKVNEWVGRVQNEVEQFLQTPNTNNSTQDGTND